MNITMEDAPDCSDGAKMLIERMKTHPQEFRGGNARWATVVNQMLAVRRGGMENNLMMSRRDANALWAAFEQHVMEPALNEHAVTELMTPKAERKKAPVVWPQTMTDSEIEKYLRDEYLRQQYEAEEKMVYRARDRYDVSPWKFVK